MMEPTARRVDYVRNDAAYVFCFFLCLFWLTNSGFDTSEAIDHYHVASHFVRTGNIGFDDPQTGIFTTAPNGRTYASHEFGNILFLIPTAFANHCIRTTFSRESHAGLTSGRLARVEQCLVSFQAGVYAALTLTFLFLILTREYEQTSRAGFLGCVAVGVGTFLRIPTK